MTLRVGTRRARLAHRAAAVVGGNGQSALYQSLVGFWALDEESGNRADGIGSNTMTDVNTVGSDTGHVYALAADFEADNSEQLTITDNEDLSVGNIDWWVAGWCNLESSAERTIASHYVTTANQRSWRFGYSGSAFIFTVSHDGATLVNLTASTFGAATLATWYWVVAWHDAANDTINIQVNNGTVDSAAHSVGVLDGTYLFKIGAIREGHNFWDGLLGPVMLGKGYVPDAGDLTFLYNDGAGRTLAEIFDYAG